MCPLVVLLQQCRSIPCIHLVNVLSLWCMILLIVSWKSPVTYLTLKNLFLIEADFFSYQMDILYGDYCCCVLTFWPGQKCHSRWCTGRKWHILMVVMRGNRVGWNWLMKWDEVKKNPWYSHRLTHRKRVTSELHDSYFRLMTIKHSISKIAWAIKWALNYYIAQSRHKSSQLSSKPVGDEKWKGKPHPAERALGNPYGVWGPEKLLIRCSRSPSRVSPYGLRLSIKRTRKTQRDGHKSEGSKYCSYVRSPALSHTQTLSNPSEPLQIKWEVNICIKKSFLRRLLLRLSLSLRLDYCVVVML